MPVVGFDHVAFPTADAERLLEFYKQLGFGVRGEEEWRAGRSHVFSLVFGDAKINVHPPEMVAQRGEPWYLRAPLGEPGSADLCFVWEGGLTPLLARLEEMGVPLEGGPVVRVGGRDEGRSRGACIHLRDPDMNLVEFMSYDPADIARYDGKA